MDSVWNLGSSRVTVYPVNDWIDSIFGRQRTRVENERACAGYLCTQYLGFRVSIQRHHSSWWKWTLYFRRIFMVDARKECELIWWYWSSPRFCGGFWSVCALFQLYSMTCCSVLNNADSVSLQKHSVLCTMGAMWRSYIIMPSLSILCDSITWIVMSVATPKPMNTMGACRGCVAWVFISGVVMEYTPHYHRRWSKSMLFSVILIVYFIEDIATFDRAIPVIEELVPSKSTKYIFCLGRDGCPWAHQPYPLSCLDGDCSNRVVSRVGLLDYPDVGPILPTSVDYRAPVHHPSVVVWCMGDANWGKEFYRGVFDWS